MIDESVLIDNSKSLMIIPDRNILQLINDVDLNDFDEDSLDIINPLG